MELALFGLDQELSPELVLLESTLLLDGRIAARIDGLVCVPIESLASFRFERFRHLRGGLQ